MKKIINVELIVKQRLRLQNVQRKIFDKYGILSPTINKFKDAAFLHKFNGWSFDKQKEFLIELGGEAFLRASRSWMNQLIKDNFQLIKEVAKNTGQSFDTAAKAAAEFSRQGLGVEETLKRTRDALVLDERDGGNKGIN